MQDKTEEKRKETNKTVVKLLTIIGIKSEGLYVKFVSELPEFMHT